MIELLKTIDTRKNYSSEFLQKQGLTTGDLTGSEVIELLSEMVIDRDRESPPELINYRTIDEFCEFYGVNPKTILRWRKKGLIARFLQRIVITDEDFRHFQHKNKLEIEETWKHQPLNTSQKQSILYVQDRLLKAKCKKPVPIISEVTGRTPTTVARALVEPEIDKSRVFFDLQTYPLHLVIRKYRLSEKKAAEIEEDVFLNKVSSLDLKHFDNAEQEHQDWDYANTLTEQQETYLFRRLNSLKKRAKDHRDNANYVDCWETYLECLAVRETIAEKNQPLLVGFRNKAIGKHTLDVEELFGRCQFALLKAIDAFDLSRETKFGTYLSACLHFAQGKLIQETQKYRSRTCQLEEDFDAIYQDSTNILQELEILPTGQKRIVKLVAGLEDEPKNLKKVSEMLGMPLSSVSNTYNSAISALKYNLGVD